MDNSIGDSTLEVHDDNHMDNSIGDSTLEVHDDNHMDISIGDSTLDPSHPDSPEKPPFEVYDGECLVFSLPKTLWLLVFFRLAQMLDEVHDVAVRRNFEAFERARREREEKEKKNFLENIKGEERLYIQFDLEVPEGFERSIEQLKKVRLVCKNFNEWITKGCLANTFWCTFWTRRGVNDVRWFRPEEVSWFDLAKSFVHGRREVVTSIKERFSLSDQSWIVANNRGLLWSNAREFDMALLDYRTSEANSEKDSCLYSNISVIYIKRGQFEEALKFADMCLKEEGGVTASALNNRGVALLHLNRLEDARVDLEKSMELDSKLPNSRLHMAYCHFKEEKYEDCVKYCDLSLNLKPTYACALAVKSFALER